MLEVNKLELVASVAFRNQCIALDQARLQDEPFLRNSFFQVTCLPVLEE